MNLNDAVVGKSGPGNKYVNEIETIVELIAEVILDRKDAIPETQLPGGTLGFEEEEKHFQEEKASTAVSYIPDILYSSIFYDISFRNHTAEVPTPPPNIPLFLKS